MNILAIDSATAATSSVALWHDGRLREYSRSGQHGAAAILSMVHRLLQESRLSLRALQAIAFAAGPGSFTGLRVCAGVTQGLAYGSALPVAPVSTLAALAQQLGQRPGTPTDALLLPALDARAGAVYWGAYRMREGLAEALRPDAVQPLEKLSLPADLSADACLGIGDGWRLSWPPDWRNIMDSSDAAAHPRAREVAQLGAALHGAGETVSADQALPAYLRWDIGLRRQDRTHAAAGGAG